MDNRIARRAFLGSSAAGGLLLVKPETAFGTAANSAVEIGIVGCGGRGNWIGGHFVEHTLARIVALADVFEEKLDQTAAKFKVDPTRLYKGIEGYRELAHSKLDGVVIETPAYFHPEQAAAAVDAGKHVYLAKPIAVDVPGCQSVRESGEKAQGKLTFLVDFQTRVRPVFQEAAQRVHAGGVGQPVMGQVYYHANRLPKRPTDGLTVDQARIRNWFFDKALSGDIIVEQNIHVIDVANWYLQGHPLQARGTGGRKARVDVGDCWDHFIVTYTYPNDVLVDFSSAQFTRGYNDLCIRLYGTEGTVDSHYGGHVKIAGNRPWVGSEKDDTFNGGAITNVKNFVESIRTGKLLNNAAESVQSNLTGVLGRMAAYRGTTVTWDEMLRVNEKLEAHLRL